MHDVACEFACAVAIGANVLKFALIFHLKIALLFKWDTRGKLAVDWRNNFMCMIIVYLVLQFQPSRSSGFSSAYWKSSAEQIKETENKTHKLNYWNLLHHIFLNHLQRKSQTLTSECVSETVQDTMVREAMSSWITWLLEVTKI